MSISDAYGASRPAEITFEARVVSAPGFFYGTRTHCTHETFEAQTSAGPVQIVDNVALAPRIPVQPGDRVRVRGEMVHDPGREPVVHWTHHDPQRRHAGGFIEWRGHVYA
ncbi:MAG: DUF3465 domain-containing protein [Candidatus Baltobacteraceae bacterium]